MKINFTVDDFGLYAISIIASCTKKHDLKVEIDGQQFREIPPKDNIGTYDIPPAWNGTKLKGSRKTVIFLSKLNKGEHSIEFFPKIEATLESFTCKAVADPQKIAFTFNQQAQDRDKRPWFAFALIDLPLISITAEASVSWHWLDGDDVKLIIDNAIEKNPHSKLWKYWVWHASPSQIISGPKKEKKEFKQELPQGTHYLEFWSDRTPTLNKVALNLGNLNLKSGL